MTLVRQAGQTVPVFRPVLAVCRRWVEGLPEDLRPPRLAGVASPWLTGPGHEAARLLARHTGHERSWSRDTNMPVMSSTTAMLTSELHRGICIVFGCAAHAIRLSMGHR